MHFPAIMHFREVHDREVHDQREPGELRERSSLHWDGRGGAVSGVGARARTTIPATSGSSGSPPWFTRSLGQTACSSTSTAPSSRPELGGVTTSSCLVHTLTQRGPGIAPTGR